MPTDKYSVLNLLTYHTTSALFRSVQVINRRYVCNIISDQISWIRSVWGTDLTEQCVLGKCWDTFQGTFDSALKSYVTK